MRALCAVCVCCFLVASLLPPPSNFRFFFSLFFFALYLFCFVLPFFFKRKKGGVHTAGTGMGNWCRGALVLCPPVCVVGALSAAAPQENGSCVLMYTGTGQGGFG